MGIYDSLSISLSNISNTINESRYLNAKDEYLILLNRIKNDINSTSEELSSKYMISLRTEIENLKEDVIRKFFFHKHHLTKEYMNEMVCQDKILDINLKGTSLAEDKEMYFKAKMECTEIIKSELHSLPTFLQLTQFKCDEYVRIIIQLSELSFLLKQNWIII